LATKTHADGRQDGDETADGRTVDQDDALQGGGQGPGRDQVALTDELRHQLRHRRTKVTAATQVAEPVASQA
jgi:hypothetical protein